MEEQNIIKKPEGEVVGENPQKSVVSEEKKEQERTTIKKKLFLEFWSQSRGVISVCCKKTEINVDTFREWRKNDLEFAKKLEEVTIHRNEDVRDILMGKILIEHDGTCTRYYLDRKDSEFRPKQENIIVTSNKTLQQALREDEAELNKDDKKKDEPGTDRGDTPDKGQEGKSGVVQVERGTGLLPIKKDEKEPDNQSPAKGNK